MIHTKDNWGFFGIFDGHGGHQCSKFMARHIQEELAINGMPDTDDEVMDLAFRLDREFLVSNQPSGSTGTFIIIQAPTVPGGAPLAL